MYRLSWYCCAILNGGRFGDLRTIYQGCRALPFALAGLSCYLSDTAAHSDSVFVRLLNTLTHSLTHPKTAITTISGTAKATDCKFGRYIHMVHPNTRPWQNFGEKGAWAYPGMPSSFQYPLLSQDRVKLRTSNLAGIFTGSIRTKAL